MRIQYLGLMMLGASAFGAGTSALLNGTPQEKATAAQTLGYAKDERAVDELAKAALDSDPAVAYAAADALGEIGTAPAADALLKAWSSGSPAALANGVLKCAEARLAAKDAARARALYAACRAKGPAAHQAAASIGLASLEPPPAADAKPPLLEMLRDEALLVRLKGIRAAVRAADAAALPALFALTAKTGEDGRAATLALEAMAAQETDAFLYGEMRRDGPERARAIALLAARGERELVPRLCDASLYGVAGVNAAAGEAFRARVRQDTFAQALTFTFGPLPPAQRGPLVSALASAVRQLPDPARAARDVAEAFANADAASKTEVIALLGGLQTEAARDLLAAQAKAQEVELRKAAVRVLSQWNSALAVVPLLAAARHDAERGVRVLAARGALTLVQKPGIMEKEPRLAVMAELAEACGLTNVQMRVVAAVNAGGGAAGEFKADTGFSGGSVHAVKLEADLIDASDAAPGEVYQSCRFRDSTYLFGGLKPGQAYTLRLHFAETFHERAGARVFDVVANGKTLLTDYDIVGKTGKRMKAVTETAEVTADAAGRLAVAFKTKRDQALVNGLEVLEAGAAREDALPPAPVTKADAKPGQLRVLLLTGANNHNWQETTAALTEIFATSPKFFVTVVEKPWEMKPADLAGYDLIFNNWNTYGKDKREWDAEMKAAFMAWVRKGGGFFVLHAGGSMFYDWDEFQALTGGAWEKGTFHPHMQAFTVRIADKEHPVTRGMADFETFDEPWQKIANRNPNRRVLVTGVVSKENKGSGEPEPFAFVTETGKGRCFNLVLGHDGKALSTAGCRTLLLRGAEWAATGEVR